MHKTASLLLVSILVAGVLGSCKKTVLPNSGGSTPPPVEVPPPPPPPKPKLAETMPANLTPVSQNISSNVKGYYKALPARYDESDETYPLIIFFHGGGQYGNGGTQLSRVLTEGIAKRLRDKTFPPTFTVDSVPYSFIVITPQFTGMPTNSDVDALYKHVRATYRIDSSRIYLCGFSLGGRMASDYGAFNPTEIAALMAWGGMPQINEELPAKLQAMVNANLPVWQFHNVDDSAWVYSEAVRYVNDFNNLNPLPPARFTTFEVGQNKKHHDCWTRTMDPEYREDGKNIYEWMLSHHR